MARYDCFEMLAKVDSLHVKKNRLVEMNYLVIIDVNGAAFFLGRHATWSFWTLTCCAKKIVGTNYTEFSTDGFGLSPQYLGFIGSLVN
jgi:hypothetical protein